MRIYFYTTQTEGNAQAKEIISYFKRADIEVIGIDASSDQSLEKLDAFVFQGKSFDTKAGYLTALALAQGKEVLCLLPQGANIEPSLKTLSTNKNLVRYLEIEFYNQENLSQKLTNFLSKLDRQVARDLFNIKYTLRVSGKINDYLNWKAKEADMPKADWLRYQIQKIMEDDNNYQNFKKRISNVNNDQK